MCERSDGGPKESCFALKGGTAINLFIRNLPRLSVDIDLTYLPIQERDKSLAHIDNALRRLGSMIEAAMRWATAVLTGRPGKRATKFQVRRGRERVQIEVSPVLRGAVHEPTLRESSPAVTEQFGLVRMPVLHPLDIYAGKLCAALDRQHPRDLFDVMQLQHVAGIDRALFEVFLVYVLSGDRPIAEMFSPRLTPLARAFNVEFNGMTLMPVTADELETARTKLIVDLHALLPDRDREFLPSVKQGNPNWTLFAHPRAEMLPAIQRKLGPLDCYKTSKRGSRFEVICGAEIR